MPYIETAFKKRKLSFPFPSLLANLRSILGTHFASPDAADVRHDYFAASDSVEY